MSDNIKNGGPAFARTAAWSPAGTSISKSQEGMALRQYYAAHAPAMPAWFEPPRKTPKPDLPSGGRALGLSGHELEQFNGLRNGTTTEQQVDLRVLAVYRDFQRAEGALASWTIQGEEERFFAWRWHYADQMLGNEHSDLARLQAIEQAAGGVLDWVVVPDDPAGRNALLALDRAVRPEIVQEGS
jgi:hypothetical protein